MVLLGRGLTDQQTAGYQTKSKLLQSFEKTLSILLLTSYDIADPSS